MLEGSFDLIAQGLLKQKYVMEQMQQENQALRRQLAELREGRGIFIEINGQRFSLRGETVVSQTVPSVVVPSMMVESSVPEQPTLITETDELVQPTLVTAHTTVELFTDEEEQTQDETHQEQRTGPTFLEEVMIDEFAVAATSPLAVWSAPELEKKYEMKSEDELEMLRRQLIGSYLLE